MAEINLTEKLSLLPDKPGAYMMKDERGDVIYVGKASSLRSRVRSYFQKGQAHAPKVLIMVQKVRDVDWLVTESEVEALMLECNLIKKHRPRYNVRLRDDKHYPYVCVTTTEPFPRVLVVRRVKQDGNKYFGPYADGSALRDSLRLIRKVFRVRSCNKKLSGNEHDRPCLNLHLGQCDSPCSRRISASDYAELVRDARLFLEGKQEPLIARLQEDMVGSADRLEFERAAKLRDRIESIRTLSERQKAISTDLADHDIVSIAREDDWGCVQVLSVRAGKLIGQEHFFLEGLSDESSEAGLSIFLKQYYRDAVYIPKEIFVSHEPEEKDILGDWLSSKRGNKVSVTSPKRGEKRRLVEMAAENAAHAIDRERHMRAVDEEGAKLDLEDLCGVLELQETPQRIEAYDISNIQGTETVASMVVFEDGVPAKSQYRRFRIRGVGGPDDYESMREVVRRRLANASAGDPKFSRLPDLILIDGGRGQLSAALRAVQDCGFCMQVISLAKKLEEIYRPDHSSPLLLPRDSRALRLLQRVRDEAHRFALDYHHKLREKTMRKSVLDGIAGVGEKRRKALVRKFGSVAGVKRASVEELLTVPGITKDVAQAVYDALQSK